MSSLTAFTLANARYWPTVAPTVCRRLRAFEARAATIEDPRRRALALGKLRAERFNPQLAATLATQAPRPRRRAAAETILATQAAYDYRDALQERSLAIDDDYARELDRAADRARAQLPGWSAIADVAAACTRRCAEAQRLGHTAALSGDERELRRWAEREAAGSGLGWPEWLAGAQSLVLCTHALSVAAAREPAPTPAQARALERLYLSIGALTMLDSLLDTAEDRARGERGYLRLYDGPRQMGRRLAACVNDARERAHTTPDGEGHLTTMTGIVAYYASAPAARNPPARAVFEQVRAELGPALTPALATMRAWRGAKRLNWMFHPAMQ